MPAQNPNALPKFVGELFVRIVGDTGPFTRLACVRSLVSTVDTSANTVEVNTDDCGTVFSGNRPQHTIEVEFLENMDVSTIQLLLQGVNRTDVAGTPVVGATQDIVNPAAYNTGFEIENQNGDGSLVSVTGVSGSVDGALVAGTDYAVTINSLGKTEIYFISGGAISTLTQTFTVTYDYTPNASEQITIKSDFTENRLFDVRIEAENDAGEDRIIDLSPARFEGAYNMNFLDVVEAGDITGASLTFIGEKGAELVYTNEII